MIGGVVDANRIQSVSTKPDNINAIADCEYACQILEKELPARLSQDHKLILKLFLVGLTHKEIAERLGKSPGTVRSIFSQFREKIEKIKSKHK